MIPKDPFEPKSLGDPVRWPIFCKGLKKILLITIRVQANRTSSFPMKSLLTSLSNSPLLHTSLSASLTRSSCTQGLLLSSCLSSSVISTVLLMSWVALQFQTELFLLHQSGGANVLVLGQAHQINNVIVQIQCTKYSRLWGKTAGYKIKKKSTLPSVRVAGKAASQLLFNRTQYVAKFSPWSLPAICKLLLP